MKKAIVMVDLDGVVLNSQYKTTKDIRIITKKLSTTSVIVPNSDTPLERLTLFFQRSIGLNAEIVISENGAIVKHFENIYYTHQDIAIKKCVEEIRDLFTNHNCTILENDAPIFIKEKPTLTPNTNFIFIDKLRRMSISMFFLTTDNHGTLHIDQRWSDRCLNKLTTYDMPQDLSEFVYNAKYGIAISSIDTVSKTSGYTVLRTIYQGAQFFMIGDSDSDIINDKRVMHLAINNASQKLKERSLFVAQRKYTAGLEQCFHYILDANCINTA